MTIATIKSTIVMGSMAVSSFHLGFHAHFMS